MAVFFVDVFSQNDRKDKLIIDKDSHLTAPLNSTISPSVANMKHCIRQFDKGLSPGLSCRMMDDDINFTQPSTSQVQRGLEKLTSAQVDQKVSPRNPSDQQSEISFSLSLILTFIGLILQTAEVVQYFLVKDQKKIPIRRAGKGRHGSIRSIIQVNCAG